MQLAAHAAGRGAEPRLIAFEPARLTAAQALRSYAAVLGSRFELARRGDHLATLLAGRPADTLTIVDGPGIGPVSDDGAAQLAMFREQPAPVELWLVLPATLRASDLNLAIGRLANYRPDRIVFTRTHETRHWGAVWSAVEWAGLPAAFLCGGPRIPEDLTAASSESIARHVLEGRPVPAGKPGARQPGQWPLAGLAVAGRRG
jgi:flagellar biosynthesis protein FlhF